MVCVPAESAVSAGVGSIVDVVSTCVGGSVGIAENKNIVCVCVFFGRAGGGVLIIRQFFGRIRIHTKNQPKNSRLKFKKKIYAYFH